MKPMGPPPAAILAAAIMGAGAKAAAAMGAAHGMAAMRAMGMGGGPAPQAIIMRRPAPPV